MCKASSTVKSTILKVTEHIWFETGCSDMLEQLVIEAVINIATSRIHMAYILTNTYQRTVSMPIAEQTLLSE